MTLRTPLLLCGALLWLAAPAAAQAQDETRAEIALQNQMLELRHDLDALRDQVASGAASSAAPPRSDSQAPSGGGDIAATLLDRVTQLEDQMRTLQGASDELRNGLEKQNADLTKQIADLGFRVQTLEGAGAAPAASSPPAANLNDPDAAATSPRPPLRTPAAPVAAPSATPSHLSLQQGYAALARRDYPGAESAARDTLATPRSPRAYDAQFLLAQSLSGQHNYQQAALAYDDAYSRQRKGAHAQDALLGLAGALAALGEKPAACATIEKLRSEFPAQRPDIRAGALATGKRAGCH